MPRIDGRGQLDDLLEDVGDQFSGTFGLAAENLATGEEVLVNADQSFPTASVIKLPILVEVFRQAQQGALSLDERLVMQADDRVGGSGVLKDVSAGLQPTIHDLATLMVIVSDNTATNMLIDRVGGTAAVNDTMRRLGLDSTVLHNRIDFAVIGDDVRRLGEAAPRDLMRLNALIARGEIIDQDACAQMIDILRRQQYLDQFPRYFRQRRGARSLGLDEEMWVGCKTGFFPGTWADSGIVSLPGGVTIAYAAMTHESTDRSIAAESEGAVTNGILGRLLIEYWWPGDWEPSRAVMASPYVDKFGVNTKQ